MYFFATLNDDVTGDLYNDMTSQVCVLLLCDDWVHTSWMGLVVRPDHEDSDQSAENKRQCVSFLTWQESGSRQR